MQPLYFNPPTPTSNYTGTNPLTDYNIETHQMQPSYFNPNLYNSFTFSQFPQTAVNTTSQLGSGSQNYSSVPSGAITTKIGGNSEGFYEFSTLQYLSTVVYYSTQFSTFFTNYASYGLIQPITFSYRFSTELETLYFSQYGATDTINYYTNVFTQVIDFYSDAVVTYLEVSY